MSTTEITDKDREMAAFCKDTCPICRHGRKRGTGVAYWFVKNVEESVCPYCQAYEKVYGVPAHEKTPGEAA
jgi:hypothetical protein